MLLKKFLIPSVRIDEPSRLSQFSRHFRSLELDLFGLSGLPGKNVAERLEAFHNHARRHSMQIYSVHLRALNLGSKDKKDVSKAITLCSDIAKVFSPRLVVLHPGRGELSSLVSNLAFLFERIPPSLEVVIENMTSSRSIIYSPQTIRSFLEAVCDFPPTLGICIDTAHFPYASPKNYTDTVLTGMEAALPRLRHLHFSDRNEKKHLPLGEGAVEWKRIAAYLNSADYSGRAVLEVVNGRDIVEQTTSSAWYYYGRCPKDLKGRRNDNAGMDEKKVAKKDIVERARALFGLPDSAVPLLNLPEETFVEEGEHSTYYLLPSASYDRGHEDPFYSLTGSQENLSWVNYLFGFRRDGGRLHVILIDRKKKIAVEERIFSIYANEPKYDWARLAKAIKESLDYLKKHKDANHVEFTFGQPELIYDGEPKAW